MDGGAWQPMVQRVAKCQTQTHTRHIFTASENEIINIFFPANFRWHVGTFPRLYFDIVSKTFARLFS